MKELAATLNVGLSTVYEWRARGIIAFSSPRRFNLEDCRQRLADKGLIPGTIGRPPKTQPGEPGHVTMVEAERRHKVALAQNAELGVRQKVERVVDRPLAETRVQQLGAAERDSWRTFALDVAEKIAHELGVADVALVRRVLDAHVCDRLAKMRELVVRLGG